MEQEELDNTKQSKKYTILFMVVMLILSGFIAFCAYKMMGDNIHAAYFTLLLIIIMGISAIRYNQ